MDDMLSDYHDSVRINYDRWRAKPEHALISVTIDPYTQSWTFGCTACTSGCVTLVGMFPPSHPCLDIRDSSDARVRNATTHHEPTHLWQNAPENETEWRQWINQRESQNRWSWRTEYTDDEWAQWYAERDARQQATQGQSRSNWGGWHQQ